MILSYDERCAADLANVIDGRDLSKDDAAWLIRVATGAIRPNRDKPLWDLAHLARALSAGASDGGGQFCDIALDPTLGRMNAASQRLRELQLAKQARVDDRGLVLGGLERDWQIGWRGLPRLLALAEFLLTLEELAHFAELRSWFDDLANAEDAQGAINLTVKRLTRLTGAYRLEHLPLAPVERRFRVILTRLAERGEHKPQNFDDDDIVAVWRAEISEGDRPQFRTTAEHFVTYQSVLSALGGLAGLRQASSLEAIEGWADRLDASLDEAVGLGDEMAKLASALSSIPDTPKILTGAERDDLIDMFWLEPFHRARPLTVLRAISFGRVQSGVANRLRRGSGGAEVWERVRCDDAETYEAIVVRAEALHKHLKRMIKIAAALRIGDEGRSDPKVAAMLAGAEADLAKVRRAGFDADRQALMEAFAMVDDTLVRAAGEIPAFASAAGPLAGRFVADRAVFATAFEETYLGRHQDDERARPALR